MLGKTERKRERAREREREREKEKERDRSSSVMIHDLSRDLHPGKAAAVGPAWAERVEEGKVGLRVWGQGNEESRWMARVQRSGKEER